MPDITAAVAAVSATVAPIVFLDTCALLDIVRAPLRNAPDTVKAAVDLLRAAQRTPPTIHLFIACPTPTEWSAHIGEAVADCTRAIDAVDAISQSWDALGWPGVPCLPPAALALPARLRTLCNDLLSASSLLDKDADALSRAIDRIIHGKKPARKGGQGAKDATIVEHAIGLVRGLEAAQVASARIFVSSNTSDFAIANTTLIHPDIKPDFDPPNNIRYAVSLAAGVAALRAGGWVP